MIQWKRCCKLKQTATDVFIFSNNSTALFYTSTWCTAYTYIDVWHKYKWYPKSTFIGCPSIRILTFFTGQNYWLCPSKFANSRGGFQFENLKRAIWLIPGPATAAALRVYGLAVTIALLLPAFLPLFHLQPHAQFSLSIHSFLCPAPRLHNLGQLSLAADKWLLVGWPVVSHFAQFESVIRHPPGWTINFKKQASELH